MISVITRAGEYIPLSCYSNYSIKHKKDGNDILTFYVDTRHPQYRILFEEQKVQANDNEWVIKKINDDQFECELDFGFLKGVFRKNYNSGSVTCSQLLASILPSGWTIQNGGISSIRRTTQYDYCTNYDIVQGAMKTYSVYFVWNIKSKTVTLYDPEQMDVSGVYLSDELNLKSISFKGESTDFATRLYAFGKDGLTMEDAVVDGQRYGKQYVDNNDYSTSVVVAYFADDRFTVAQNLYDEAIARLKDMAYPARSYECDCIDLAKMNPDYEFLTFYLHKKVKILDSDRGISVIHQVVEYKEYPDEPERNVVTLSAVPDGFREAMANAGSSLVVKVEGDVTEIKRAVEEIADRVDGKTTVWYSSTTPTEGVSIRDIWYDTANHKIWRKSAQGWDDITDEALKKALDAAEDAQTTADGKIVTYAQATQPTAGGIGDLWIDTDDYNKLYRYNGTGWVALMDNHLDYLVDVVDGKTTTWYGTEPSSPAVNDIWYDTTNGKIKRCNAVSPSVVWQDITSNALKAALDAASDAQTTADSKIVTYAQTTQPTSGELGDLWIDTDDGNKLYRYNGTGWVSMRDDHLDYLVDKVDGKTTTWYGAEPSSPDLYDIWYDTTNGKIKRCSSVSPVQWQDITSAALKEALDKAATAQSTADSKIVTHASGTQPQGMSIGDIWINTSADNKIYRYNGSSWIPYADTHLDYLVDLVDEKTTTWYGSQPSSPAVNDIWYDTTNGKIKRCTAVSPAVVWQDITSNALKAALDAAGTAQATADSKIVTFATSSQPTATDVGDLWIDTGNGNLLKRWNGSSWVSLQDADIQQNASDIVALQQADTQITQDYKNRIQMSSAFISGAYGGYVVQEDGELFIMDTDSKETAQIVWRWNVNGFAKSSTGFYGTYSTSLTFDDTFITNVINAMIIRADSIEANSITASQISTAYSDGQRSLTLSAAQDRIAVAINDLKTAYLETPDGDGKLDIINQAIATLSATIDSMVLEFGNQYTGGTNLVLNSSGLNSTNNWTTTGTVTTVSNEETRQRTVSNSAFRIGGGGSMQQVISNLIVGRTYTVSVKIKKTGTASSSVKVTYNGGTSTYLFNQTTTVDNLTLYSFTIENVTSNSLTIKAETTNSFLSIADVMVSESTTPQPWTPAQNEIYTTGVKVDRSGIEVYREDSLEKTVINNHEFAGYYKNEQIFTLNKDETVMQKTRVEGEFSIGDLKAIPYNGSNGSGINFTLLD